MLPKLVAFVVMVSLLEASKPVRNSAHSFTTVDLAIVTTFGKSEMQYSKAAVFEVGFKFADFVLVHSLYLQVAMFLEERRLTYFVTVSRHCYLKVQSPELVRLQISSSTPSYSSYFSAAWILEFVLTLELVVFVRRPLVIVEVT